MAVNHIELGSYIKGDGKRSYLVLKQEYTLQQEVNDYASDPQQHLWVNTLISNVKTFIQGTYHGVAKKYLILALAEFEWRFNRRTFGMSLLNAMTRTVLGTGGITHKCIVRFFHKIQDSLLQEKLEVLFNS